MFRNFDHSSQVTSTLCKVYTSDQVKFLVCPQILAVASPAFAGIFAFALRAGIEAPAIQVEEYSDTWDQLMCICYPMPNPEIKTLDEVRLLIEAATKYSLEVVVDYLRRVLALPKFVEEAPLRVYAIACMHGFEGVGKHAAKMTFRQPIGGGQDVAELAYVSGMAYHRLLEYRLKCQEAKRQTVPVFLRCDHCSNSPISQSVMKFDLGWRSQEYRPSKHWLGYLEEARKALVTQPYGGVIASPALVAPVIKEGYNCKICATSIYIDMMQFVDVFQTGVEETVSQVSHIAPDA
ncbi:uncharacterized protein FIBRA_07627 [Fibroporia radiculosa]|uniref:BTB domain-containing protein n=1 Tax=Fibroporia radiculosa TaxID=599839 RepID=J4GVC9_9APHY|nr:uncharacterized protein FIBRA_07627 [Fibroporia radiculosa]CCM05410.1 predicted protein [Fibroporia radiculosa]